MIGSTLGLVAVGLVAAVDAAGLGSSPSDAASAVEPAVRLGHAGKLAFPVEVGDGLNVLNNFGGRSTRNGSCSHNGIDIGTPTFEVGRELYACTDGIVLDIQHVVNDSRTLPSQGNSILLLDPFGDVYRYHHLDAFVDGMQEGDRVARGDLVGYMGLTGNTAWPHLHFEVRRGGKTGTAVDPVPLLPFPIEGVDLGPPTGCA